MTIEKHVSFAFIPVVNESHTFSIVGKIWDMLGLSPFEESHIFLGIIIFVFSIGFPVAKYVVLFDSWDKPLNESNHALEKISFLGKWSMLDVMLVAIAVFAIELGDVAQAIPRFGLYFFAASVVMSMIATYMTKSALVKAGDTTSFNQNSIPQANWGDVALYVYSKDTTWGQQGGVFIFTGLNAERNLWVPLFIGQCSDFSQCIPSHEKWIDAQKLGATHVHATVIPSLANRDIIERKLIQTFQPRLNLTKSNFSNNYNKVIASCPQCRQSMNVPATGKIKVKCPSCSFQFIRNG